MLTDREIKVLEMLEERIDTIAFVVSNLANHVFTDADALRNVAGLDEAVADCSHELRAVRLLKERR